MLNEMTVVQLKEMLRERGLKVSGRKAELIERIEQFDEAVENYNTSKDVLVGYGAMYDYINRNITNEIDGATGGNFLRSRIDDLILNDNNIDFIGYLIDDVENLLDFYTEGGNEHSKAEINEVRQFLNFLTNLSEHTLKRGAIDVWNDVEPSEPSEAIEEVNESDEEVNEDDSDVPADEPTLVNKPTVNFEGRTTIGRVAINALSNGYYDTYKLDDSVTMYVVNNSDLCASEGLDDVTMYATNGIVDRITYVSRGAEFEVLKERFSRL